MKLHTYVIATDAGSAPNYDGPFTTLAVCKPRIRKKARAGDVVLAFTGATISAEPHAVCWTGVIREKLTFQQYWTDVRFRNKRPDRSATPDNIYEPQGSGFRQVPNRTHGPEALTKDVGGEYVLVCDPAWHFGATGPILPASFGYRISALARRGERVHDVSPEQWDALRDWLTNEHARRQGSAIPSRGKPCKPSTPAPPLPRSSPGRC